MNMPEPSRTARACNPPTIPLNPPKASLDQIFESHIRSLSSILRHGPLRYLHLAHLRINILPQVAGTGQPRRVTADHREALSPQAFGLGFPLLERFWFSV